MMLEYLQNKKLTNSASVFMQETLTRQQRSLEINEIQTTLEHGDTQKFKKLWSPKFEECWAQLSLTESKERFTSNTPVLTKSI